MTDPDILRLEAKIDALSDRFAKLEGYHMQQQGVLATLKTALAFMSFVTMAVLAYLAIGKH